MISYFKPVSPTCADQRIMFSSQLPNHLYPRVGQSGVTGQPALSLVVMAPDRGQGLVKEEAVLRRLRRARIVMTGNVLQV